MALDSIFKCNFECTEKLFSVWQASAFEASYIISRVQTIKEFVFKTTQIVCHEAKREEKRWNESFVRFWELLKWRHMVCFIVQLVFLYFSSCSYERTYKLYTQFKIIESIIWFPFVFGKSSKIFKTSIHSCCCLVYGKQLFGRAFLLGHSSYMNFEYSMQWDSAQQKEYFGFSLRFLHLLLSVPWTKAFIWREKHPTHSSTS